uniref:Ig-like domain-containing protein n=1 Tax=Apteryx owenii TaxID=8824 RepID=A0A8B9P9C1_APTOW
FALWSGAMGRRGPLRQRKLERMAHEGALPAVAVDQKEKQKPEIVLVPEPVRVLEGETARFRCRVTGYPLPKVNWYLNGQLIRKSKRFRLRYDGIYYLDIVDYVTSDDSASIMVKAVNIAGETSSHAFLLVQVVKMMKDDEGEYIFYAGEKKTSGKLIVAGW